MAKVDGAYEVVTKTPMGDQQSVLTVISDENGNFHGTNAGMLGSMDVKNGRIDGNKLTWTMDMVVPMPLTLEAEATVDGDAITGTIQAGAFGAMAMTGKRRG
jgi:hypothetical protein